MSFEFDIRTDDFDFSKESGLCESLLEQIKEECFGDLSEDQLELISAARADNQPPTFKKPIPRE